MTLKFEAKTYGISAGQRIQQMNAGRVEQNKIANGHINGQKGGATTTVPQFPQSGAPAGPTDANTTIKGMAAGHLKSDALSQYNHCVGQPKGGTCGGSRRRRRSRRSRKYKVKH